MHERADFSRNERAETDTICTGSFNPPTDYATLETVVDPRREIAGEESQPPVAEHFARLLAVLVRILNDAAMAFDVATETIAAAVLLERRGQRPSVEDLVRMAGRVLVDAAERGSVPSVERRRLRGKTRSLSSAQLDEIARLGRDSLALPSQDADAMNELMRSAPGPGVLGRIELSPLVQRQALAASEEHVNG
jgi:hypothetical protein